MCYSGPFIRGGDATYLVVVAPMNRKEVHRSQYWGHLIPGRQVVAQEEYCCTGRDTMLAQVIRIHLVTIFIVHKFQRRPNCVRRMGRMACPAPPIFRMHIKTSKVCVAQVVPGVVLKRLSRFYLVVVDAVEWQECLPRLKNTAVGHLSLFPPSRYSCTQTQSYAVATSSTKCNSVSRSIFVRLNKVVKRKKVVPVH